MSNQTKQKRPKYTLEFKKDAAKLVIEKGYTHNQAADSLGISLSALGRWVRAERGPATSISAEKKSALKALMMSMFMIVELILSIFLEKTTKKDNKNPSIAV